TRVKRSCTTASALAPSKSFGRARHFLVLRVLGAKLVPAFGAEHLRRGAGNAHDIGETRLLAAEGLVEKLSLQASKLDVVSADIGEHIHVALSEARLVVRLDDRDACIVEQLNAWNDPVAGRRQDDQIVFLRDEILEVGVLGGDVAAVAVD